MKKFEELKQNETFKVGVWEIKPSFGNEEFINKYIFNGYIQGLVFSFIKDSDKTCKELITGTQFEYQNSLMTNEEKGLYFFGSYVNNQSNRNIANKEYTLSYFETAEKMNSKNKKLIKKIGL